ncbi:hypothetical protein DID88_008231 [Monilinia fructigena]|uniref:Uncharacterized protein n=1 Tax=Monilinia fructigena TaxID=38457 RepID=A0A395J5E8_9HELO|nr:hypothetical protein DID88_008231 [Monilinia fructigena]
MTQNLLNRAVFLIIAWYDVEIFSNFHCQFIKLQTFRPISNQPSSTTYKENESTITVVNNSTADVYVSVTYSGDDFQKEAARAGTLSRPTEGLTIGITGPVTKWPELPEARLLGHQSSLSLLSQAKPCTSINRRLLVAAFRLLEG